MSTPEYTVSSKTLIFKPSEEVKVNFPELGISVVVEGMTSIELGDLASRLNAASEYMKVLKTGGTLKGCYEYNEEVKRINSSGDSLGVIPVKYVVGRSSDFFNHGPFSDILQALRVSGDQGDFIYELPSGRKLYACDHHQVWSEVNE